MIAATLDLRPLSSALAAAALVLFTASLAAAATGGDGGFGYTWRDSADGAGIHVTGGENRIDGNHVAKNDRGILIDDGPVDRNWVVRNTARFNAGLNYVIPAGNRVGVIAAAPVSGAISGDTDPDALGAGTLDPWANFSY